MKLLCKALRSKTSWRPFLLSFLFLLPVYVSSQTDTLYIKSYYNNLVPRFLYNYKNQMTNFAQLTDTSYSADYFVTGSQHFMGVDLGYKWATLGYNFTFDEKTSSTNTDLRFSTSYRLYNFQANYTELKNLNYYRVNGEDELDTVFKSRERKIRLRNFGFKVEYIFNHKKFCYSSVYSQGGRQLKSKGSFILSSGISYQDFDLRRLSDSTSIMFIDRYRANVVKSARIDVGPGYAYNWVVLKKRMVLSISEIPNIGFQQITSSKNGEEVSKRPTVSFTNYVRAGFIYTWNRLFGGASVYNSVTASKWNKFNYNNVYTSVQVYFGIVLDTPKSWRG